MVSKFENPTPGAESPSRNNAKDSLTISEGAPLAARCYLWSLPPWFSMHFKSIATFLAKSANEKNPFGRRKVAFAECELSVDHITITCTLAWRRLGAGRACNIWLPQGPSYSMNVVVHIGKQRLCKPRDCHQAKFSPCEPCDNGKTMTCGSVYRAKSVNGEVDGSGRAPVNFLKESFVDEETCRD